jgi:heptosyltransferase-2
MNILVIRGGALGDFLLTLPAVAGLREKWPEARIEMVAAKKFGELVTGPGAVDAVRPIDRPGLAGFYATGGPLDPDWCDYFSEFDLTLSYLFDPDGIFAGNRRRGGGTGEYLALDPKNPTGEAWRYLARPLQNLGIEPGGEARMYGRKLMTGRSDPGPGQRLVIHPGSGSPQKNWPLSHWVESLDAWRPESSVQITWLSGEAEGKLLEELPEKWRRSPHRILREKPLPEVFEVLRSADLYLGHDSGISHLAAWAGVRCGLLFGPTDPKIWAPPGAGVKCWSRGGTWPEPEEWAEWLRGLLRDG